MSNDKSSVVFFDAHAIDMINSSAGTIANYTRAGHRVTLVALNAGEKGSFGERTEEYRRLKIGAWEAAARIVGVDDVRTLHWKDAETPYNEEVTNTCVDIMREVAADIVVTHWKGSFHKDHVATYQNVMDAVFLAGLPGFEARFPAHPIQQTFFTDNWEDWDDFKVDTYVDITDTIQLKLEAIEQFMIFMRQWIQGGFNYKDFYHSLARMRGCLSRSFTYAECYATRRMRLAKGTLLPV